MFMIDFEKFLKIIVERDPIIQIYYYIFEMKI